MDVVQNQSYRVKVEVLRTDTEDPDEKVSAITLNGEHFGSCNPDGGQAECSYFDCLRPNNGDYLNKTVIRSSDGQIRIELRYSNNVHNVPCPLNGISVTAAARVTLTPIQGEIN